MIITETKKNYERPDSGEFVGVIADAVDLGTVPTKFGPKVKIRLVWVLDRNDSEGKPFRAMKQINASLDEKSELYKTVAAITGAAPQVGFDTESLIGKANTLFIVKEKSQDGKTDYANIKAILPLKAGAVVPAIPADFVRAKDKNKNQTQTQRPANAPQQQAADVSF